MALHPVLLEKLNETLAKDAALPFTRRDIRLPAVKNKVHAVIGMRRAGKTTFLQQLLADRRKDVPHEHAIYVSFDDDRLAELELDQLGQLLEEYYRRYPALRHREKVYWFLDEIQMVSGWERFVRRVMDSEQVEFVVSGSSARMLSREVHTSLRGRGMETIVRPFSFREFLRHRDEEPAVGPTRWPGAQRSLVEKRFREFLVEGGFPEAQALAPALQAQLLQGYVDTVLFRDVVERHGISQVAALRWIARHCLRNPAGSFSAHRLHNDLRSQGLGIAKDAVHALLGHLLDAFLISAVPLATESLRRRNSNPRKVYPADPGLIPAFDTGGRTNPGHALETVVLNELERRGAGVEYVKTEAGLEVDFHGRFFDGGQQLIQVCADMTHPETAARELRALQATAGLFPKATRHVLTLTRDRIPIEVPKGVLVQPVWEWILADAR